MLTVVVDEQRRFRDTAGRLPTGVVVLGVTADGLPHAMTANSFSTVSLDPPLVLVCVRRSSRMATMLPRAGAFAATVLPAGADALSRRFADPSRPAGALGFGDVAWTPAPATGSPMLDCGLAYFDCALHEMVPAGDHDVFIGRVDAFDTIHSGPALVFADGGYRRLGPRPAPRSEAVESGRAGWKRTTPERRASALT
jgi:flavin reductase